MTFVKVVIKKDCMGSEDGIYVKQFTASPDPVQVEEALAGIFIAQGWASLPVMGKAVVTETKVVAPDTKVVKPLDEKKPVSMKE